MERSRLSSRGLRYLGIASLTMWKKKSKQPLPFSGIGGCQGEVPHWVFTYLMAESCGRLQSLRDALLLILCVGISENIEAREFSLSALRCVGRTLGPVKESGHALDSRLAACVRVGSRAHCQGHTRGGAHTCRTLSESASFNIAPAASFTSSQTSPWSGEPSVI